MTSINRDAFHQAIAYSASEFDAPLGPLMKRHEVITQAQIDECTWSQAKSHVIAEEYDINPEFRHAIALKYPGSQEGKFNLAALPREYSLRDLEKEFEDFLRGQPIQNLDTRLQAAKKRVDDRKGVHERAIPIGVFVKSMLDPKERNTLVDGALIAQMSTRAITLGWKIAQGQPCGRAATALKQLHNKITWPDDEKMRQGKFCVRDSVDLLDVNTALEGVATTAEKIEIHQIRYPNQPIPETELFPLEERLRMDMSILVDGMRVAARMFEQVDRSLLAKRALKVYNVNKSILNSRSMILDTHLAKIDAPKPTPMR